MTGREPGAWAVKYSAKALLGYILDTRLSQPARASQGMAFVANAWDAWWACYRAGLALGRTGIRVQAGAGSCPECSGHAALLAITDPPGHSGNRPGGCDCLPRWAAAMRAPGPGTSWPPAVLSLALIKPQAPAGQIHGMLGAWFEVLKADEFALTTAGTRRLYPEAYGAGYVADRDAYLTSAPVRVLVLRARNPAVNVTAVKASIRRQFTGDSLRNQLHMPDNPGEALADIAQFGGYDELTGLYRRYERDHTAGRLAFYRAALGISEPGADRLPAAG